MVRNYVHIILIQVSIILVSRGHGQQRNNNERAPIISPYTKFGYPFSGYYPPWGAYPYQYPYGYGQFPYYPQQSAAGALYSRPSPQIRPPNGPTQAPQQYYLGPMNAAQVQYLVAYVKSLMSYGNNTITAPQIPSTPTQNASSVQPTPTIPPSIPPSNTSSEPTSNSTISSPEPLSSSTPNEFSQPPTTTIVPPEFSTLPADVRQSTTETPPVPIAQIISAVSVNNTRETVNNSVDHQSNNTLVSVSDEPILRSAHVQSASNPFVSNSAYPTQDWLYPINPAVASFYGNLPPSQPFYPNGFGPWNPFVQSPATSPAPQLNATQQTDSTFPQSRQANTSESETLAATDTAAGGVLTNQEDFPPQVQEFIKMIPDILAMHETSELDPSNNDALIHQMTGGLNGAQMAVRQFGGGPASFMMAPKSYDLRNLQRFKKKHSKSPRRHDNYFGTYVPSYYSRAK